MIKKYLLISVVLIVAFTMNLQAQNCFFRLDSIGDQTIRLDSCWKYHPGDNMDWAARDFPDENWDTASTTLNLQNIPEDYFTGMGWFRLHLSIDSTLMDKTRILYIRHNGASEIYLNGTFIKRNGRLGLDDERMRYRDPVNLPIPVHFDNKKEQVIAVRYVNSDAATNFKKYSTRIAGFTMTISDLSYATTILIGISLGTGVLILVFSIFLVLGGLHLLIFLFFRDKRSNLYYSIFALLLSLVIFSSYLQLSPVFNPSFTITFTYYVNVFNPAIFIALMLLVYNLFYDRLHIIFWVFTAISVGIMILNYLIVSWSNIVLGITLLLIFVEIFRLVIRAMIKKISGSWIVGTGILMFVIFLSAIVIIAMWKGQYIIQGNSTYALLISGFFLLAVISIPLSMSVYLARDFAVTNKDLKIQFENVKVLSAKTIEQEKEKQKILAGQKEKLEEQVKERTAELESEKEKTEQLLLNTLPVKVVKDLKENGKTAPESFENVTVYFSDIVGFTNISTQLEPVVLIGELNEIFTAFDDIMVRNQCERIKTIGDAYLAVCGMPERKEKHAEFMARAALEIRQYLEDRNKQAAVKWNIRIGLHSGKVVGGIVGVRKYIYDVFGDTINTTSRMESNSEPMRINISETTYLIIKDKFKFTPREPMEIKGKGLMRMYFLEG